MDTGQYWDEEVYEQFAEYDAEIRKLKKENRELVKKLNECYRVGIELMEEAADECSN